MNLNKYVLLPAGKALSTHLSPDSHNHPMISRVCEKEINQTQKKQPLAQHHHFLSNICLENLLSCFCFCFILDVCIERRLQIAGRLLDIHFKDTAGCVSFSLLLKTFIFLILTFQIRYSRDISIDIGLTTSVIIIQISVTL